MYHLLYVTLAPKLHEPILRGGGEGVYEHPYSAKVSLLSLRGFSCLFSFFFNKMT